MCNTYYLQQLLFMIYLSNVQGAAWYNGVFASTISSLLIRKTVQDYGPLHSYIICHECSYHRTQWLYGSKGDSRELLLSFNILSHTSLLHTRDCLCSLFIMRTITNCGLITLQSYDPNTGASCLLPFCTNTFWTISLCLRVCLTVHQSVSRALHLSALSVNSLSCLFIHLSVHPPVEPPPSLSVHLPIQLYIYVLPPICVCLSIYLSVHPSDHPNPSIHLSVWSAMRCITYSHS